MPLKNKIAFCGNLHNRGQTGGLRWQPDASLEMGDLVKEPYLGDAWFYYSCSSKCGRPGLRSLCERTKKKNLILLYSKIVA